MVSRPGNGVEMGILIIDDDPHTCQTLERFLKTRGHRVFVARRGSEGLEILRRETVDIVITDFQMPEMDGLGVMRAVREIAPEAETIMITGYGDMEKAVQAMRAGAFDFFTKPLDIPSLVAALERTARFCALRTEKNRYQERLEDISAEERQRYGLSSILGESAATLEIKQAIRQVSASDATSVLIQGETGTGKELVARAIHYESKRAGGPFVAVDCSSIPESLAESELFGHLKGAFTDARAAHRGRFERADKGTLFLDEIGDMPLVLQPKLLRALEERRVTPVGGTKEIPVDVRVISATHRDLPHAVAEGRFREDLLYRLNTVVIRIPPLRERPEDIPALAQHFLSRYAREMRKPVSGFTPEALTLLQSHPFPGNIRELRNLIEQAVIFCRNGQITPEDLKLDGALIEDRSSSPELNHSVSPSPGAPPGGSGADVSEDLNLSTLERRAILEALRRCGGNKHHAARLLGISRFTLLRRMAGHQIQTDPE